MPGGGVRLTGRCHAYSGRCVHLSVAVLALGLVAGCSSGTPADDQMPTGTASASSSPAPGRRRRSGHSNPWGSGLVRVQVNNCVGRNQGSGFFVADDLMMTAAPSFTDAASIAVRSSTGIVRGDLVGLDKAKGVALVRLPATRDGSRPIGDDAAQEVPQ